MELRRLAVCLVLFVAVISQCSEAHSMRRRQAIDDANYDDNLLADEAGEEDTQNDTDTENQLENEVTVPATIVTAPANYEFNATEDVRMECKVSPDATVVSWFKNNVQYFLGSISLQPEETRYSIAPNSKDLLIKNTKGSDSGIYRCEAMQKVPVAINHTLLIKEKPFVNISASHGVVVGVGSELTLTCYVTGSPVPNVIWSRNRNDVNERLTEKEGEFSVDGNSYTLHIKNIKREQAGAYYCYALNSVGNHQADTQVIVNEIPRVHVTKTTVNSDLQIEAVLECTAHEEARPHIRWYKGSALIEDSSTNYRISTLGSHSNLTVFPTTDADFGTFTCEAENAFGKHNRSVELVQKPVIEDLEIDGTKMSWVVHSHQPLEAMEVELRSTTGEGDHEWRQLTVPVPEGKRHKYEISYLLEDKQLEPGNYEATVKVKNTKEWGSSNEPALVQIEDAQPQYIQHASVIRGGSSAHSIRPAYTVLSTILMYLLVRML